MRPIPQAVIDLVKREELFIGYVYDDEAGHWPVRECTPTDKIIGVLTAGYGHTGPDVKIGLKVSNLQGLDWLIDDLKDAAFKFEAMVGADTIALLSINQYAAMLDFCFNLGAKPEWTIWTRLKQKAFDQVPLEMGKFVNVTIKTVDPVTKKVTLTKVKKKDLVDRRNAEIALWATNEPGTIDDQKTPSSVTRSIITPPTPSDPTPMAKSKQLIGGAVGLVAGAPVMVSEISKSFAPIAEHTPHVQAILSAAGLVSAIGASVSIVYMFIQKHRARN